MKVYNYKYQTKQWLPQHDYNLYDFGARMYACPDSNVGNPVLARFTTPDPLMQFNNPYLAMGANPVSMVDPTGMWSSNSYNEATAFAQEQANYGKHKPKGGGSNIMIDGLAMYGGSMDQAMSIMYDVDKNGNIYLSADNNILDINSGQNTATFYQGYNDAGQSAGYSASYTGAIKNVISSNSELHNQPLTNDEALYAHYNQIGFADNGSYETDDVLTGYSYGGLFFAPEPKNVISSMNTWLGFSFTNLGARNSDLSILIPGGIWRTFLGSTRVRFESSNISNPLVQQSVNRYGGVSFVIGTSTQTLSPNAQRSEVANFPHQPGFIYLRRSFNSNGANIILNFRIQAFVPAFNQYLVPTWGAGGIGFTTQAAMPVWYAPEIPGQFIPDE